MQDTQQTAKNASEPTTLSDADVVARVLGGDKALFEIIMRRHNQSVYRIVRGIVKDNAEAEEVVQEAYLNAYRSLHGFRNESSFKTWLTRIAIHEAIERKRRSRQMVLVDFEDERGTASRKADSQATPEENAENRQLGELLEQLIDALPESLRLIFVLREVEGYSVAETARLASISEANVKVRVHRARSELRDAIGKRLGGELASLYAFGNERCGRVVASVMSRISGGVAD